MNKTLEILFDDFVSKRLAEEPQAYFSQLYDTVTAGKTASEENEIYTMFGAYEVAVEAEAFKAGFYTAVELLTGGGQK